MSKSYYSNNNFDLIRLVAASQVLISHTITHLQISGFDWILDVLSPLPGVPAFFFVSGFLITAAWERNPDALTFYRNRFYRIFPGLWVCVLLCALSLLVFYDRRIIFDNLPQWALWITAQSSFLQSWNPAFLRNYGTGVVNGSLWTIPVELFFYLSIPMLFWLCRRVGLGRSPVFLLIAILSFSLNYALAGWSPGNPESASFQKALTLSPLPWMGMFCLGVLAQQHIDSVYPIVAGRVVVFFLIFAGVSLMGIRYGSKPWFEFGNHIGFLNYVAMCLFLLSAAYSFRGVSDALLHRNDYSYGIYILHMPIINIFVQQGCVGPGCGIYVVVCTIMLAMASWWLVERPALRRKKCNLYER